MVRTQTQRSYDEYKAEYVRLDAETNWQKGDLLIEMGEANLSRLAEEMGVSVKTMYALREVAAKYPENSRRLDIPWSVYQTLLAHKDRLKLIQGWDRGTVAHARHLMRKERDRIDAENRAAEERSRLAAGADKSDIPPDQPAIEWLCAGCGNKYVAYGEDTSLKWTGDTPEWICKTCLKVLAAALEPTE